MKFLNFLYTCIVSMVVVCYVLHKSIISYIVQKYHYADNMINMESSFFAFGDSIANNIEQIRVSIFDYNQNEFDAYQYKDSKIFKQDETNNTSQIKESDNIKEKINANTENIESNILREYKQKGVSLHKDRLYVKPNSHFILIGDSLMQGIGMTLVKKLKQEGLMVKNIAKQSTGLTYPSFFNWSNALKQAFTQNPDISVVVVCLGANDPWNMPKITFGSETWKQTYKERIQDIIDIAHNNNAIVVWYQIPAVKNTELNKKILYLNEIYKEVIKENDDLFLSSQAIMPNGNFTAYINDLDGKSRLVRAQDGIHFARYGSELLSQVLLEYITIKEDIYNEKNDMKIHINIESRKNDNKTINSIKENNAKDITSISNISIKVFNFDKIKLQNILFT